MSSDFVHLHVHSDYSILDGLNTLPQLLDRCEKLGMDACALTDHGNLFGAVEFYKTAKGRGIKPIIGSELYVAPVHRAEKSANAAGAPYHHMVLLCENETGYHNLCRLSTIGYLEGFYHRPRVDDELLAQYHEGLIATSGCVGGRIPQAILNENLDAAHASVRKYMDIFGKDNFLIEIMDHGLPEERRVNPVLIEMAKQYGLTLVATNDAHYLDREDFEAHEVLLCAQTQTTMEDPNRFRFQTDEFYFRSQQEMERLFASCPEAVRNTRRIAERCNAEIPLNQSFIPKFVPPEGRSKEAYLHDLVMEGLHRRYGAPVPPGILERARFELRVIEEMKFVDYFLVVWDLIRYAREAGIPVGPGRGSGAGSIVAYALQITNIDPIRYNLLFERFLNPDRISMPDFDIDFCYNRRDEMIKYARDRYGADNVSQIITFGRMLARQVIRNVGRVLAMPYGEVDRIAKLIPEELKITLKSALEKEPDLRRIIAEDPQVARLWRLAERLEGTINNCGTHAAGVVICDQPLTEHIALFKAANSDTVCTQVEMKGVEDIGLLKMDFLGLRTLTVVHEAARLVRQHRGIAIDIDNLEPNDEATYELLRSGQTTGVFQLESPGMRDLAKRIGLQSLEEICALVALYRPGPMQFIDTYVENKYHPERIRYDHPKLEPILKETYGIALYQEQVMQIVQALAGFSLGEADILRRAMGKKKADLMAEQRGQFVEGCLRNGIPAKLASELFDKIETFAGYGFNKSHSMAYAFVAYQTAYLKAHYPVEFMCALLTSESGNLDKVAVYVEECRRMNIDVLPPDVNHSFTGFSVEGNAIRFGLSAIKNVGVGPTEAIVTERESSGPFKDVFDFCRRLESRIANKRLLE
ncbi:MAG TPA: DNA polymerase III subunit alpha, partial [Candidatus Hydrogenedentes bacterium]|nr:DNA polymerase III subunit alpha [Candidatus Hydrogenedentota bacterium]